MTHVIEPLAKAYLSSMGHAAANNIHIGSNQDTPRKTWVCPINSAPQESDWLVVRPIAHANIEIVSAGRSKGAVRSGCSLGSSVTQPTDQGIVGKLIEFILSGGRSKKLDHKVCRDAVKFIAKVPPGLPFPEIDFGEDEILFEWRGSETSAVASVEGDGLVGYAMKINGSYRPGAGPEDLNLSGLPNDLVEYLQSGKASA
ncbi:hypothetical protein J3456_10745 [Sulfitobacter sp. NFXS29]|uniref:hypothetical protein n=1 Tax=Sulfitobacter sp. NFXS29 TaxID=2818438 RepID=UPI0032DFA8A7